MVHCINYCMPPFTWLGISGSTTQIWLILRNSDRRLGFDYIRLYTRKEIKVNNSWFPMLRCYIFLFQRWCLQGKIAHSFFFFFPKRSLGMQSSAFKFLLISLTGLLTNNIPYKNWSWPIILKRTLKKNP